MENNVEEPQGNDELQDSNNSLEEENNEVQQNENIQENQSQANEADVDQIKEQIDKEIYDQELQVFAKDLPPVLPEQKNQLRACLECHLLKTKTQWNTKPICENCGFQDNTKDYEGVIGLIDPSQSWVAKRLIQLINSHQPENQNFRREVLIGAYALKVQGADEIEEQEQDPDLYNDSQDEQNENEQELQ